LFAPLALLAPGPAAALFTALCIVASLGTLWVLSVRDWRLYGLVLLLSPVMLGWQSGNVTPAMALAVALLWRWRDRAVLGGLMFALLVCIKPIAVPLGVWLLATRRYAAVGWALSYGVALSLVAWWHVGFGKIAHWLHLLSIQGDLLYRKGYGLIALVADAGLGRDPGTALAAAATCVLGMICLAVGRRRHDLAAFTIAVVMMITVSPQVDEHYFILLLVPLAIARPRLEPIWFAPLILWLAPTNRFHLWQVVLFWIVVVAVATACLRTGAGRGDATQARAGPRWPRTGAGHARTSTA
jgi:hypothetical protein